MLQVFNFGLGTLDNFWQVLVDYYQNDQTKYDDALEEIDSIMTEKDKSS